ncbi:MAG: hypothetical protein LAN36_01800 [Acidobacteriia bacterium]|nr:hypothetical protein [Terriglobia bacterium]
MRATNHTVYFIGAGMTKSLQTSKPVPTMFDFVSVMADYVADPVIRVLLIELERAKLYDCESPTALRHANALAQCDGHTQPDPDLLADFVRAVKDRPHESIESLLRKADSRPGGNWADPLLRFRYGINRVFYLIGEQINWEPLERFLREQTLGNKHSHTFVSFNYDITLECALQRVARREWSPVFSYGFPIHWYSPTGDAGELESHERPAGGRRPHRARPIPSDLDPGPQRIRVLKPHGSLNWLLPYRCSDADGRWGFDEEPLVVLCKENGQLFYSSSTAPFQAVHFEGNALPVGNALPFVMPPTGDKQTDFDFLNIVRRAESAAIRDADRFIVVGWSMPESDSDEVRLVQDSLKEASGVKEVTAVNISQPASYFERVAAVFGIQQQRLHISNDGFPSYVYQTGGRTQN